MNTTIILIGPMGAGKTTIGELLSKRLNLAWVQLDEIRWAYYDEIGYDRAKAKQLHEQGDLNALMAFMKPLEAQSVTWVVAEYHNCVIDFGAGQSVYEDETLLAAVKDALAPFPNVILLMPSENTEESIQILNTRIPKDVPPQILTQFIELNEYFVKHRSNYELAKMIVYTKNKSPEQVCDEIIGKLK